jgi:rhomboid protease GluP
MVVSGVSPARPAIQQLLNWGANWGPLSLGVQPWRILTSNYVHGGIIHIFFNMWCLWNLGALAERVFDRWTYLLVYTATGLAGSIVSLWWRPASVGVGASGAIFGVAGALIAALYLGKLPIPKDAMRSTLRSLVLFAGYNLLFGLAPGIDNSAHLGGLLSGLMLGAILAKHMTEPREIRERWRFGVFVATALVLFAGFTFVKHSVKFVRNGSAELRYFDASSSSSLSLTRSIARPRIA